MHLTIYAVFVQAVSSPISSSYLPTGCLSFFLAGYFRLQFFLKLFSFSLYTTGTPFQWETAGSNFFQAFSFWKDIYFYFSRLLFYLLFLSYRQNFFNFLFIRWEFHTEHFYHIPSSHPTPPRPFSIPTHSTSSFSLKKNIT